MSQRPILVTGAHRSGTTWIGKMLALAPGVGYVHEPFSPLTAPGISGAPFDRFFAYVTAENAAAVRARPRADAALRLRRPPAARRRSARLGRRAACRTRLRRVRPRAGDPRAAARQGSDRALLGRVARGAIRDGRRRHDPPPGRVREQPAAARLDARLRRVPGGRAAHARPPGRVRGRDPGAGRRAGGRPRAGDPALAHLLPDRGRLPAAATRLDVRSPRGCLARAAARVRAALRAARARAHRARPAGDRAHERLGEPGRGPLQAQRPRRTVVRTLPAGAPG